MAGSAHSSCHHPDTKAIHGNPLANIIGIMGGAVIDLDNTLGVVGSPHGIRKGWFSWPLNFDPVWLEKCNGFEALPPSSDK